MGAQAAQLQQSHIPDFITQTDASGNATTPRSAQAIEGARKIHPTGPKPKLHVDQRGKLTEDDDDNKDDSDVDEACDTIVDSFRLMCCCLLPNDAADRCLPNKTDTQDFDEKNRIKLLGPHHPDDTGKKCLVLDLDETLVHSSFRAVPGADFVIPVQVRICF
jgi:TFIIF-interacting CTD phosphatase-like protein